MKYYAVIDTNVLVSSLLKTNTNPAKIISYVRDKTIVPIYDQEILDEYQEVLSRKKFPFSKEQQDETLNMIKTYGRVLEEITTDEQFEDEEDIKFFQIVLAANMIQDSYLITGNKKHFPQRVFVVDPATMVKIVESNK